MKYQVIDTGKPADHEHCPSVHKSWDKSIYDTFEEAFEYAKKWFNPYLGGVPRKFLEDSKKYEYQAGVYCQIKEIEDFPNEKEKSLKSKINDIIEDYHLQYLRGGEENENGCLDHGDIDFTEMKEKINNILDEYEKITTN